MTDFAKVIDTISNMSKDKAELLAVVREFVNICDNSPREDLMYRLFKHTEAARVVIERTKGDR